jgi:7,8-dihydro-6-hydroxymethylpterin dimethyltransferase
MHKPIKYVEKGLTVAARGVWTVFDALNSIAPAQPFTPKWSDKPIQKSWQKVKPPLGWPRETDSLCPTCVREARQEILDGKRDYKILLNEKVGEIKANIIERGGKILMVKDCPEHGHFEDVMAIDPAFFKHLEDAFPGSDIRAHNDEKLHNHGTSTIKYGRGSVLTIVLGRHQDAARQRDLDQAEAPDVGAVLGRRADDVAVLSGRRAVLEKSRVQQRAGRDQRHRVRQEP